MRQQCESRTIARVIVNLQLQSVSGVAVQNNSPQRTVRRTYVAWGGGERNHIPTENVERQEWRGASYRVHPSLSDYWVWRALTRPVQCSQNTSEQRDNSLRVFETH